MPDLENTFVNFMSPNATSYVPPLDAGFIASLKAAYRERLLLRVFDNIACGAKLVYNVDILTTMKLVQKDWDNISAAKISN